MLRLLRNRGFWIGASIPVALAASLIAYGSVRGSGVHAAGSSAPTGDAIATSSAASISGLSNTPAVVFPASLGSAVAAVNQPTGSAVPSSLASGSVNASQAHLLLSTNGASGAVSVYAATTTNGTVCIFETGGPAGCVDQFDASAPITWLGTSSPSGVWSNLYGLAPDNARSVALQEGSGTQQATLRNNAFYVEPAASPSGIVVTYDDGTTQSVALPLPQHQQPALGQTSSQQSSTQR
jgi:hypothetical protein